MDAYEKYYNDRDINEIIDTNNEMLDKMTDGAFRMCHGRYHTMFVVDTVEYILKSLSYDARTIELGKIAALLHDIGCIAGRWNHARKSAALATVFLDEPIHLLPEEVKMIIQAIEDHSDGKCISSAAGAALLIADKMDFSKNRCLPLKSTDAEYINDLKIDNVDICVSDKSITVNCVSTESFSKDLFKSTYTRYNVLMNASEYLGCAFHFQFNGTEESFNT